MSCGAAKVALVFGASGGLGSALVETFSSGEWQVVGTRNANETASSLIPVDLRNADAVNAAVSSVIQQHGRLDCVVNTAGICEDALLARLEPERWDATLDVNLKGAMYCARAAARVMMRGGGGHLIHIGSYVARAGRSGQTAYAAAKAALIGLNHSMAREYGGRNVRFNIVLPGVMPTRMIEGLDPEQLAALTAENALRRFNTLEEIAAFIVFLAGTANISGQVFQIDSRVARWT